MRPFQKQQLTSLRGGELRLLVSYAEHAAIPMPELSAKLSAERALIGTEPSAVCCGEASCPLRTGSQGEAASRPGVKLRHIRSGSAKRRRGTRRNVPIGVGRHLAKLPRYDARTPISGLCVVGAHGGELFSIAAVRPARRKGALRSERRTHRSVGNWGDCRSRLDCRSAVSDQRMPLAASLQQEERLM